MQTRLKSSHYEIVPQTSGAEEMGLNFCRAEWLPGNCSFCSCTCRANRGHFTVVKGLVHPLEGVGFAAQNSERNERG